MKTSPSNPTRHRTAPPVRTLHLDEDQLDDLLIAGREGLSVDAAAHLYTCAECAARLAEARLPLESFKAMSLAWAERRSATMPASLTGTALHGLGRVQRWAWGATAMAAIVMLVAVPVALHERAIGAGSDRAAVQTAMPNDAQPNRDVPNRDVADRTAADRAAVSPAESNAAEIAQDNRLLNAVDYELDTTPDGPASLGLQPLPARAGRATRSVTVRD